MPKYWRSLEFSSSLSSSQRRAQLESDLSDYYLNVDFLQSLTHARTAVRLMQPAPPSYAHANVLQSAAYYEIEAGNYRNAEALSTEALAIAQHDSDGDTAWTYKHIGEAQDGAEELTAAWQNFSAGRDAARKENGGQGPTAQLVD